MVFGLLLTASAGRGRPGFRLQACDADQQVLARLAGHRNRPVHFYDETERELYEICTTRLGDIEQVTRVIADWTQRHPERFDHRL